MNFAAGTALRDGKYLITHVSGQRDASITLKATQSSSHSVILKTLNPALLSNVQYPSIKQRFCDRVNRFSQCRHPALVCLLDSFEEQNLPFAVMDCTRGQPLAELIKTEGVLAEEAAISYIKQIGAALEVLHRHGLIHGNVTPKNIVHPIGSDIVVLVNMEFINSDSLSPTTNGSKVPRAGEYAPIECYQPQPSLTPATDLYSLAGVFYFLLTGQAPVAAPLRSQTAIVAPRQFRPQLSAAVEPAILKGLEMRPQSRPASIGDWLAGLPVPAPKPKVSLPTPVQSQTLETVAVQKAESVNGSSSRSSSPPQAQNPSSKRNPYPEPMISFPSKRFSGAFLTTATVAAAIGVGTGLALRLAATTTGPGASFFHSEQSFPDLNGWPGEITPIQQPAYVPPPAPTVRSREYEVERPPLAPVPPPQQAVIPQPEAPTAPMPEAPAAVPESVAPPPASTPAELAPESSAPSPPPPPPPAAAPAPEPAPPAQPAPPPPAN